MQMAHSYSYPQSEQEQVYLPEPSKLKRPTAMAPKNHNTQNTIDNSPQFISSVIKSIDRFVYLCICINLSVWSMCTQQCDHNMELCNLITPIDLLTDINIMSSTMRYNTPFA